MPRWTEESRARQREVIMKSKPWEKATGPKTVEGKKTVASNPIKHGLRTKECETLLRALAAQDRYRRFVSAKLRLIDEGLG